MGLPWGSRFSFVLHFRYVSLADRSPPMTLIKIRLPERRHPKNGAETDRVPCDALDSPNRRDGSRRGRSGFEPAGAKAHQRSSTQGDSNKKSDVGLALAAGATWRDQQQREIRYIRLSLTDRCNYRCTYCRPASGLIFGDRAAVLSFDEIELLAQAFAARGVQRIRLTGGEPTLRQDLPHLIRRLKRVHRVDGTPLSVVMTTNGDRLVDLAKPLQRAGLDALTVSIDSLDKERFAQITRGGRVHKVIAGIEAAREAGFSKIKLNTVAIEGFNGDEIGAMAEFAWKRGVIPRFIELMPMAAGELFVPGALMPATAVRERIRRHSGAHAVEELQASGSADIRGLGPASYWRVRGGAFAGHRFGTIAAMTENFCASCNRLRVSATGQLHACLANDDAGDLRAALRSGEFARVEAVITAALRGKRDTHLFQLDGTGGPKKAMISIGG